MRSPGLSRAVTFVAILLSAAGRSAESQETIQAAALRSRLFALADDSMMGRQPGMLGNSKASDYVAAEFQRLGLTPMGEKGTYFQLLPFARLTPHPSSVVEVDGNGLTLGTDYLPVNLASGARDATVPLVYGGMLNDPATWITAEQARGKAVIFGFDPGKQPRGLGGVAQDPRFREAAVLGAPIWNLVPPQTIARLRSGAVVLDPKLPANPTGPLQLILTSGAAERLTGPQNTQPTGVPGKSLRVRVAARMEPVPFPARNVIALIPGSDPALRGQFVSLTAHNDHVGLAGSVVDHDSIRAFNHVVRPMGADSPNRPATADEQVRIGGIVDSLRKQHAARPDSIMNGADDDGTGTVALLEIARSLMAQRVKPRRSILFVSHTAEEMGLLGSRWFTDHATVPRDSIVAEIDMDMIGRGNAADLPAGGPGYLEIIGAKRLSTEFGDSLEAVNARQTQPFTFNYEYDQPGHPLQYYCRADHYSYARYGIPATALSRGEHLDYHQVTDEPQYIDYEVLARVARLVRDAAMVIGNMDHRPALNGPRTDPNAPCRQ
jgi:hypothetical protein